MFKLLTLQDGYAYLPIEDYRALIDRLVLAQQVPSLKWFLRVPWH